MTLALDARADVWVDPAAERIGTPATVITGVRTVVAVALAGLAVPSAT